MTPELPKGQLQWDPAWVRVLRPVHEPLPPSRFALRFIRPDPRSRVTDPVGDIVSFVHSFEEKYGRAHPVFYQGTYSQVSARQLCAPPPALTYAGPACPLTSQPGRRLHAL